jgi:hypothetical protein
MSRVLTSLRREGVPNEPFFRCRLQNYIHLPLPDIVTDVDEAVRQLAHIGGPDRSLRAFKHGSILYAAGRLSIPTIKRKYDLQYPHDPLPSESNLRNSKVYYEFCFDKHPLLLFWNVSPWNFQRLGQEWLHDTFTVGPLGRFFHVNRGFFRQELDRFLSGLPSEPNGVVFDDTLDILEEIKADLRKSTGATESRKRKVLTKTLSRKKGKKKIYISSVYYQLFHPVTLKMSLSSHKVHPTTQIPQRASTLPRFLRWARFPRLLPRRAQGAGP